MKITEDRQSLKVIGKWMKEQRVKNGYTQLDVSTYMGKVRSWCGDMETGRNNISFMKVLSLCEFFHADPMELVMLLKINETFKIEGKI